MRLTASTVFHCASVISVAGASRCSPALLKRMSMADHAESIVSNMAVTSSSRETSARTAIAAPPARSMPATTRAAASGSLT